MLLDEELYDNEANEELIEDHCALADEMMFRLESAQRQYEDLCEKPDAKQAAGRVMDDINFYENELHKLGVR